MEKRNLDGYYFRIKTENGYENVCFTDLTDEQANKVLENRSEDWLKSLIMGLKKVVNNIGEELGLYKE